MERIAPRLTTGATHLVRSGSTLANETGATSAKLCLDACDAVATGTHLGLASVDLCRSLRSARQLEAGEGQGFRPTLMIAAHMDEIGFYVKGIDDKIPGK